MLGGIFRNSVFCNVFWMQMSLQHVINVFQMYAQYLQDNNFRKACLMSPIRCVLCQRTLLMCVLGFLLAWPWHVPPPFWENQISMSLEIWRARLLSWPSLHLSFVCSSWCVRMACSPTRNWSWHWLISIALSPSTRTRSPSILGPLMLVGRSGLWHACVARQQKIQRRSGHVWQSSNHLLCTNRLGNFEIGL